MKIKQFLKLLKSHGAIIHRNRGKGSHMLVSLNGKHATVPMHNTDYPNEFLDDICKQLDARLKELQQ